MLERDRALIEQVVAEQFDVTQVEWIEPGRGWSAHVKVTGNSGLVGYLLTSPEWQEMRFEEPHSTAFILTTTDIDDVRESLTRLAKAVRSYVSGASRVEAERGLFGQKTILVPPTEEGEWRVGRRSSRPPR